MFRSATCATSPIQLYDDDDDADADSADDADEADGGYADDLRHSSTPSHALGNVIIISVIQFGIIGH